MSLAACTAKIEADSPVAPTRTVHFVLPAEIAQTKTAIEYANGKYKPYFKQGDQLAAIFALPSSGGAFTPDIVLKNSKSDGATASFDGDGEILEGKDAATVYSIYPAPEGTLQGYEDGTIGIDVPGEQIPVYDESYGYSFDPKADILIATPAALTVIEDEGQYIGAIEGNLQFARVTGILRIGLNAASGSSLAGERVKELTITTSSGDIAGRVVVDIANADYSKTNSVSGSKSIKVTPTDAARPYINDGSTYNDLNNLFVCVAPVTIPAGSTLTFSIKTVDNNGADAHTLTKTIESTPANIVFESSKPTVFNLTLSDDEIEDNTIEYTLVKDASELTVGSEVVIAASSQNKAMGTQTSNNRAAVDQEKSEDGQTIIPGSTVQILTIVAGNSVENAATIAFYTGDGYLYAASSSSNYLRTEETLSDNSSWKVTITEAGVATIVAQGTNTHNLLMYNSTSSCFSCYSSGQQPVAIYKRSTPDNRKEVTLSFTTSAYELSIGTDDYNTFNGQTANSNPTVTGIKYALTGDAIGTVDENTGAVTLDGTTTGTATITASYAGDANNYKPAAPVSYTITVDDPNKVDYVTLPWGYPESGSATKDGINNVVGVVTNGLGSDYAAENHAPYLIKLDNTGDYFQIKTDSSIGEVSVKYKMIGGGNTSTLTINESTDGEEWTKVEDLSIAGSQNSTGELTTSNAFNSESRYVQIVFTKGSNVGIGGISITKYDSRPAAAAPTFSPAEGEVAKGTTVSINCTTIGATIYYTTDGSTPTDESTEYSDPIVINAQTTIKAIAFADGYKASAIASATYTVPTTIADVIEGGNGSYTVPNVTVFAIKGNALILGDASGKMYAYKSDHGLNEGDVRTVSGSTTTTNNGVYEFDNPTFTGSSTTTVNHGTAVEFDSQASSLQTILSSPASAVYIHAKGTQSGRNITTAGGSVLYLSATEDATDGKSVEVYGYIYFYSSNYSNFNFLVTSIKEDPTIPTVNVSPSSLSWEASEYGAEKAKTLTVKLNEAADPSDYSVNYTDSDNAWTITDNGTGIITVYPKAENTDQNNPKTLTLTISNDNDSRVTQQVELTQTKANGGGTIVYTKITSTDDLTDGDYLIVYEDGSVAFNGGLSSLDVASNTISVTISNSTIAQSTTVDGAAFTYNATSKTLKSKSGLYIGQTSNANGLASNQNTAYTNTISFDDDGNANIVSSGGAYLRYNTASNQARFRYYKSSTYTSQKAICLYKRSN